MAGCRPGSGSSAAGSHLGLRCVASCLVLARAVNEHQLARRQRRLSLAPGVGRRSVTVLRGVLLLGSAEPRLGASVGPLQLPESGHGGEARTVHLCSVQVIALAVVESLGSEVLDPRQTAHDSYRPALRADGSTALELGPRCLGSGSLRCTFGRLLQRRSNRTTAGTWPTLCFDMTAPCFPSSNQSRGRQARGRPWRVTCLADHSARGYVPPGAGALLPSQALGWVSTQRISAKRP